MKLMVLDGNSVINRAYYGVRALTTRDGLYTNAIYGFLNILEKLRAEEQPDALCVTFDLKAPTFRHLAYDGYKATRHPMPDELAMQLPVMKDVLRAMRIACFACEGWEADDVIGTISKHCAQAGWDCIIVTGDRDSLQLVDESVTVKLVTTKLSQTLSVNYTPARFREEYGFDPIRLIDYKALMGDSSDNIPGVAGIGPKTASQLLWEHGTLDGVYANLDSIKEKTRLKLEAGKQNAYLSYDLATIRTNAPIDFSPEACRIQDYDEPALYALFERLEFTSLIVRYGLHAPQDTPAPEQAPVSATFMTQTVSDALCAQKLLAALTQQNVVCLITEPGLRGIAAQIGQNGYYFTEEALDDAVLHTLFSDTVSKVTHDCKPLQRELLTRGITPGGFVFDTALADYDLDPTQGAYDLDHVVNRRLGFHLTRADAQQLGESAARVVDRLTEAAAVAQLYELLPKLLREAGMEQLYYQIELPLCRLLAEMETVGVQVDQMALICFGNMLQTRTEAAQQTIYELAGHPFNINSPRQLGEVLFDELKLPTGKKTKNGYSTNADVLDKLKGKHPIIEAILDYRAMSKLKSTYADGLLKQIADDGRIHTTFQNLVTATGRLSSTDPNLQNIPVRTELGSEIRKMFVPADGCVFVDADYSQIELRVLAHIADDTAMQEAFRSGFDIHTATAAQVFDTDPEQVTPLMRRHAKAVNFGIVYGISEFSLSEDIGVTRQQARQYIDQYLEHYAGVRAYMHDIVEQAKRDGFVTTLFGRRRELPELKSNTYTVRAFGERVALNSPIQGTAADIIKLAMLHVDAALKKSHLKAQLVLQVHDELIVECPVAEVEQVKTIVTRQMQQVAQLRVPLLAEAKSGASWYEAK